MDLIYHGCFKKNADGTNRNIAGGEKCFAPTAKYFWKYPEDIEAAETQTRSQTKKQHSASTTIVESIYTGFFFVAVFSSLPSIFSALLEDSKKVSFQRGFARYLRLSRVPVQGVKILVVLGR